MPWTYGFPEIPRAGAAASRSPRCDAPAMTGKSGSTRAVQQEPFDKNDPARTMQAFRRSRHPGAQFNCVESHPSPAFYLLTCA